MESHRDNTPAFSLDWTKVLRRISIIIGLGVLVNIIIVVFSSERIDLRVFLLFRWPFLLLATMVGVLPLLLHALALKLWGTHFQKPLPYKDALHVASAALLGSAVTPTLIGGGPLKLGLLMLYKFRAAQAALIVSMNSVQDAFAFVVLVASSILVSRSVGINVVVDRLKGTDIGAPRIVLIIAVLLALLLSVLFFFRNTKRGKQLIVGVLNGWRDFVESFQTVWKSGKMIFLYTTAISVLRWFFMYLILVILIMALGPQETDLTELWSLQWIVFSGMTVTPLPGGAGGAEAGFYFVFKPYFTSEMIIALILVWRFFTAYIRLIYAAILMIALPGPTK